MRFEISEPFRNRMVALTEERWGHILQGHPEMAAHEDDIAGCIQAPDMILQCERDRNTELFYKRLQRSPGYCLSIKVVVRFSDIPSGGTSGEVITSFKVQNMVGGSILWLPAHLTL